MELIAFGVLFYIDKSQICVHLPDRYFKPPPLSALRVVHTPRRDIKACGVLSFDESIFFLGFPRLSFCSFIYVLTCLFCLLLCLRPVRFSKSLVFYSDDALRVGSGALPSGLLVSWACALQVSHGLPLSATVVVLVCAE